MNTPLRILVVGCGHMGTSHARAYHNSSSFEITGLVSRSESSRSKLSKELGGYPQFSSFEEALDTARPDAVCISTYPDTHEEYTKMALGTGCHVFLEKPVATTVRGAESVFELANKKKLKIVVGYILQHHPAWNQFVHEVQQLGKPLVMRMNLNQQSCGLEWKTHKSIMSSLSPIVDCGVHYAEVMCRMTSARPVRVQAIGARLSNEISETQYNYGQLQVIFDDGSVGWYEAGWGPMVSKTAFFVKDVMGPRGSVSIQTSENILSDSADVHAHTKTGSLIVHSSELSPDGTFAKDDKRISVADEPDHDCLCALEQEYFLRAITEDLNLTEHWRSAVESLRIVLAADESIVTGNSVLLPPARSADY